MVNSKPSCKLTGEDGNVFNLAGKVTKTLKRAECTKKRRDTCKLRFKCLTEINIKCLLIEDFQTRLKKCESYHAALALMMEYVDVS